MDLFAVKLLLNITISTTGTRFTTLDIKYFFLMMPMERYEYIRLKFSHLPKDVIKQYNLRKRFSKDGYVYLEIRQGIY